MKLKAPDAAATERSPICWFPGIFLATSLTIISASAATDAQTSAGGLNSAEKWVAAQVSAGEIADLSKKFPTDNDRKLSAHFLEELLAGSLSGVKPHRNGVRIICAIIDEPIDLGNSRISCEVWLGYCKFNSSVTFSRASFAGVVSFDGSRFKEEATFTSMKVGHVASFSDAVFEGPVDFVGADITSEFHADGAHFQNRQKTASFSGMKVRGYALFSTAVFEGPVDFSYADFAWLDLSNPFWPKVTALFHMQGMSYKYIRAVRENEPESHKALLRLADQSAYTAVYMAT